MTAYTVPKTDFAHGGYPNADQLNTHSTAQVHLDEVLSDYAEHPLVFYNTNDSVQRWKVFTHTYRFLHYASDGSESKIMRYSFSYEDNNYWTGSETWLADNSISLSNTNGNADQIAIATYDLDSISWLAYGDEYVVFDCWCAYEYDEAYPPLEATPPFVATNYLSAAALNSQGRNIAAIKGRCDAPMRPRLIESDDYWEGPKLGANLRIKGTIMDDTVSSIAVYVGDNPSSMGSADFTLTNGGSGWAADDAFDSGSLSLAALDSGQDFLVKMAETGSGYLRVEQIFTTDEA